ncbi:MAG TPA: hypothetical protein VHK69_17865 [Chitinophagaceae bacterium]|nr:hypothetical protein [Chitinophagaceae bacterium]
MRLGYLLLTAILLLLLSCREMPEAKTPVYSGDADQVALDLISLGNFRAVTINARTRQQDDNAPRSEIEITLFGGDITRHRETELDTLAKKAARMLSSATTNMKDFGWVTVLYDTTLESTEQRAFVYRPDELR